jgi:hypothetical protein
MKTLTGITLTAALDYYTLNDNNNRFNINNNFGFFYLGSRPEGCGGILGGE